MLNIAVDMITKKTKPIFTCAVFRVALYGTSESVARCLPASNTFRFLFATLRQIA